MRPNHVTTTPAALMRAVEGVRAALGMTKAELARRAAVRPETVRRLLTDEKQNPCLSNVLDMLRPLGFGLCLGKLPKLSKRSR